MKKPTPSEALDATYTSSTNNPILIAVRGVERLFAYAKPLAIVLLVVSLLLVVAQMTTGTYGENPAPTTNDNTANSLDNVPAVAVVLGLLPFGLAGMLLGIALILAFIFLAGVVDASAAASANNRKITLSEAIGEVMQNFWPYALMRLIVAIKILLWTLLFSLPGIYFSYRYVLSGVVFFAEGARGNAAVKRSLRLTSGAWLTTFTSFSIVNILTLGAVQLLCDAGTSAELYSTYKTTVDAGKTHPRPHVVSWLVLGLGVAILMLVVAGALLLGLGAAFSAAT